MLSHRLEEMQEEVANFQELLILGVGMWSFQCVSMITSKLGEDEPVSF